MNEITITNITGTSPYDLYVCDVTNTLCVFISGLTSVPPSYTFIVPPPLNTSGSLLIKIIDGDGCERFEYYACYQTPTPTPTPTPTVTPTPSPLPSLPGIYYGKFNNNTITSADTGSLTFVTTNDITNTYVTFPTGNGYGYVLIPITLPQPSNFKDSNTGCTGNDVPTNNIGTVVVLDANGFAITYNIYRTFYSFNGQLLCWLCS